MYNGIGLSTVRGSATSGHIQKNLSHISRSRLNSRLAQNRGTDLKDHKVGRDRPTDPKIADHMRKRAIEVQLVMLREDLEEEGIASEEIERRVEEARAKEEKALPEGDLDNDWANGRGKRKYVRENTTDTHLTRARQEAQTSRARKAFGLEVDYPEGASFDKELQEKRKQERIAARAKNKEEAIERREKYKEEEKKREAARRERDEKAMAQRELERKTREKSSRVLAAEADERNGSSRDRRRRNDQRRRRGSPSRSGLISESPGCKTNNRSRRGSISSTDSDKDRSKSKSRSRSRNRSSSGSTSISRGRSRSRSSSSSSCTSSSSSSSSSSDNRRRNKRSASNDVDDRDNLRKNVRHDSSGEESGEEPQKRKRVR